MPRPKKRPRDWSNEEVLRKLFPKEARKELRKTARDQQKRSIKKDST
jgi:hypothetical protein